MATKDRRIDDYIATSAPFAKPILKHLRRLVHKACPEVEETVKWGMPHFDYKGPMCGMAAFKQHCSFGFWKSWLVLGTNEDRDGMGSFGRITSLSDLPAEKTLLNHIRKAAGINDAGIKSPARARSPAKAAKLHLPDYFADALRKNKKASETFDAFSISNRKEYIEWITGAKREETRQRRLETALDWLSEGKSLNWRYERK